MKPLIIFEMANNHGGDVAHGIDIIRTYSKLVKGYKDCFDFGFKLQYRDLDNLIHPAYKDRMDLKFIKRFSETRLKETEFLDLKLCMDMEGFIPICTPFDEASVDLVEKHGYKVIKVASCSFGDWPLLERIALSKLPIIASTAGVPLDVLDKVVTFLEHRERPLTLLHCVGEYPTPLVHSQLNQIGFLKERYPQHQIGLSSHEDPDETLLVSLAIAKGATVFERHVGLEHLNAYSMSPTQTWEWLDAASVALQACGTTDGRHRSTAEELSTLMDLRRGVYLTQDVYEGERIDATKVAFQLPYQQFQLTANHFGKYSEFIALGDMKAGDPLFVDAVEKTDMRERVVNIVDRVKALIEVSHTVVGEKANVELSHHYGLDKFEQYGLTIIEVVNRAYCKKLLVMLPHQDHPEQYHKKKEETFHVLHGVVHMMLDGVESIMHPGDVVTVEKRVRHHFWSETGAVIEEVSSTHYKDDSYYTDPAVAKNKNRKTQLTYFFG